MNIASVSCHAVFLYTCCVLGIQKIYIVSWCTVCWEGREFSLCAVTVYFERDSIHMYLQLLPFVLVVIIGNSESLLVGFTTSHVNVCAASCDVLCSDMM